MLDACVRLEADIGTILADTTVTIAAAIAATINSCGIDGPPAQLHLSLCFASANAERATRRNAWALTLRLCDNAAVAALQDRVPPTPPGTAGDNRARIGARSF